MLLDAMRAAARPAAALAVVLVVLFAGTASVAPAADKPAKPAAGESAEPPPQVQTLLNLLADPAVRAWLEKQKPGTAQSAEAPPAGPSASGFLADRVQAVRAHLESLVEAVPRLHDELSEAGRILYLEFEERGLLQMALLLALFVGLGFGVQGLFFWFTRDALRRLIALPLDSVADRLRAVGMRLAYGLGILGSFALGSLGAFLIFTWPPLVRDILLGYLSAFLALRLAMVVSRFFLAPGGERFRIVPMSTEAAWFWHRRILFLVGWFAFWFVTLDMLRILGVTQPVARLIAYTAGLGLLACGIEMAWRRPSRQPGRTAGAWLATGYFGVLWLLWVASSMNLFWLLVVIVGVPAAIRLTERSVNHLLRPPGSAAEESAVPSLTAVCLERGLRAAWIIAGALLLAHAWNLQIGALAEDTAFLRVVRGLLMAVVILLVADFAWNVLRALIDRKLIEAQDPGPPDSAEAHRRARLRTLLPILRNMLLVVLAVLAVLMALSSMGVEIGPLIAGAGVVGVAVGFGAQTLVRDIFSGIFYLTDDAFRVGEYIQSGNYKGTVESFSLRSVKLRHHRGPLYTVPFGTLGAVQNMSRDWVIDKLTVGITYDSDLDKAKKLIKQIGRELQADPEFGKNILEPLKMQGVEQFGDYAIQIRMKMKTRPGEQFTIRRRALAMIKKAFDANDIKFAFPTVQVAGGAVDASGLAAAARQSAEAAKAREEPA